MSHLFADQYQGGLSFLAFLLSIFIYSSVFNLSLSSDLLDNTKFWFCISNTLVLIIAADYNLQTSILRRDEQVTVIVDQERENREQEKEHGQKMKIPAKTYRRSKSEKARASVERKKTMRRSKTVKRDATEEEKNEFEKMTDEELNRRVEEFIQRFNRQIRLQDVGHGDEG